MTKILSISVTDEERDFLDMYNISPTALMKTRIQEMMTSTIGERKKMAEMQQTIERLQDRIAKTYSILTEEQINVLAQ